METPIEESLPITLSNGAIIKWVREHKDAVHPVLHVVDASKIITIPPVLHAWNYVRTMEDYESVMKKKLPIIPIDIPFIDPNAKWEKAILSRIVEEAILNEFANPFLKGRECECHGK
jgi:hypothetical protein